MTPDLLHTFRIEAHEIIESVEKSALVLETDLAKEDSVDILNEIFRGFHNIKGSAGMFGFSQLTAFTHKVETLLDLAREGELTVSVELVEIILGSADHVRDLLEDDKTQPSAKLLARIDRLSAVGVR